MSKPPRTALELVRRDRGWSQRDLAARMRVSQPLVSQVERGARRPSDAFRIAAAYALNVHRSVLFPAGSRQLVCRSTMPAWRRRDPAPSPRSSP